MFKQAAKTAAAGALALNTFISPAGAFGHSGSQQVKLDTYKGLIAKMPQGQTRTQLEGFANLLTDYAVECATTNHSPELESQLNEMLLNLESSMGEAGIALPAEQSATAEAGLVR